MTAAAAANSRSINSHAMMFDHHTSPMAYMGHHHLHHHLNRDMVLQEYYMLHEQHESLRQHLDELRCPSQSVYLSPVGATPDAAVSPSDVMSRHAFRSSSIPSIKRVSSLAEMSEVAVEEAKLCDVNEGIKRALTELLNCEAVRHDRAFRTWVQSRLMDTERELRSGRRRRSAPEA